MKIIFPWKRIILSTISTMALGAASRQADSSLAAVMQRPLIVGASVSADWATQSPGKRLALRFTDGSQIKTIAFGGKTGSFVLQRVGDEQLQSRTVVIGLDLFFWDATQRSPDEALREMRRLLSAVRARDIPILLGEIPELLPGLQPQAALINQELRKACSTYSKCKLIPLNEMLMKTLREGTLTYKGTRYDLRQLIPDGLHIGPIASEYIADVIHEILSRDGLK
jgi:hypothetical protein